MFLIPVRADQLINFMKAILKKIPAFRDKDDNFRLGSAIAVGFLLISFIGAAIYVLLSSYGT
jgi:uncharacterized membrane protein (DUF485 family)